MTLLAFAALPSPARASLPLAFQGQLLTAADGGAVSDTLAMDFRIHEGEAAGAAVLWESLDQQIVVEEGLFVAYLDIDADPDLQAALAAGKSLWLGVTLGQGAELAGRIPLAGSLGTVLAQSSQSLLGCGQGGAGVPVGGQCLQLVTEAALAAAVAAHAGDAGAHHARFTAAEALAAVDSDVDHWTAAKHPQDLVHAGSLAQIATTGLATDLLGELPESTIPDDVVREDDLEPVAFSGKTEDLSGILPEGLLPDGLREAAQAAILTRLTALETTLGLCQPKRCGDVPFGCGPQPDDGCGNPLDCGLCSAPTLNLCYHRDADGTVSLRGCNGEPLGPQNPAYVTMVSALDSSKRITLRLEQGVNFRDGGAGVNSQTKGWLLGVTADTPWEYQMPAFLYAVNKDDTAAGLAFAVSRDPTAIKAPTAARIGSLSHLPSESHQGNFILLSTALPADYEAKPARLIGATQLDLNEPAVGWVFHEAESGRGIGEESIDAVTSYSYVMVKGQMGAAANQYTFENGPKWNIQTYQYRLGRNGVVDIMIHFYNGVTNGTDGNVTLIALPYYLYQGGTFDPISISYTGTGIGADTGVLRSHGMCNWNAGKSYIEIVYGSDWSKDCQNNGWKGAGDVIYIEKSFAAFRSE